MTTDSRRFIHPPANEPLWAVSSYGTPVIEREPNQLDEKIADELAVTLDEEGFWAMPLTSMCEMLDNGDNVWVAPEDRITPHLEVKFARDEFDRGSLENAIAARIGDEAISIGPLERQVAYKLHLGAQKNIEDAVHLYALFEESVSVSRIGEWTTRLDVGDEYERLKRA